MLCKVTHCAGHVSANTKPHQLRWGDQEMGTAISYTECSQVAVLIQKSPKTPCKAPSLSAAILRADVCMLIRSHQAICEVRIEPRARTAYALVIKLICTTTQQADTVVNNLSCKRLNLD